MTQEGRDFAAHQCAIKQMDNGQWDVLCVSCGHVSIDQDFETDAQIIANRHEEVGGFERR